MAGIKLKVPDFLKLDEASKKEVLDQVTNSDIPEKQKSAAIESMTFLDNFHTRLKNDPTLTLKEIRRLLDLHEERLKKLLLTH